MAAAGYPSSTAAVVAATSASSFTFDDIYKKFHPFITSQYPNSNIAALIVLFLVDAITSSADARTKKAFEPLLTADNFIALQAYIHSQVCEEGRNLSEVPIFLSQFFTDPADEKLLWMDPKGLFVTVTHPSAFAFIAIEEENGIVTGCYYYNLNEEGKIIAINETEYSSFLDCPRRIGDFSQILKLNKVKANLKAIKNIFNEATAEKEFIGNNFNWLLFNDISKRVPVLLPKDTLRLINLLNCKLLSDATRNLIFEYIYSKEGFKKFNLDSLESFVRFATSFPEKISKLIDTAENYTPDCDYLKIVNDLKLNRDEKEAYKNFIKESLTAGKNISEETIVAFRAQIEQDRAHHIAPSLSRP